MKAGRPSWVVILASVPIWPIVWLLVFASVARLRLGLWPSYGQPDPSDLHLPLLDVPVLLLLLLAPVAFLSAVVIASHRWFTGRPDWRSPLWAIGSFLVFVLWLRFDPGGLFGWWID